jgi:hypothetical protein
MGLVYDVRTVGVTSVLDARDTTTWSRSGSRLGCSKNMKHKVNLPISHSNPDHAYFFTIHVNIILPSTSTSPK